MRGHSNSEVTSKTCQSTSKYMLDGGADISLMCHSHRASVSLHFAVALAGRQRFAPHFSPRQGPTTVMDIEAEEPARNAGDAGALMARGLLGTLRYASWRCGCRALEAESITFRFLLPARPGQSQVDMEMEERKITSAYGRIEVLESNMYA